MLPTSVIIPCFNAASTLSRALDSCIAQPEASQIIVVDDGSADASRDIAAHYAAQCPRVKSLPLSQNSGPARARNWGAMHADFDTLAFLDADDEYVPGALADATGFLARHPDRPSIRLNIEFCGFPDEITRHPDFERLSGLIAGTVPSSLVIRRSAFMALGGFPADEIFRVAGGEDMPLSKALFLLFENRRLTGNRSVRMHFHAGIHAARFFSINMGFSTDPDPAQTAALIEEQMRVARRAVAAFEELRGFGIRNLSHGAQAK
ncbi:glycosyl transferase family 2 [Caballeronia glebae]|uniref:Glycosyl transferase family 2 n=1 Tax=Caballeronia glebae TaxID=1777143 RepID=A0A158C5M4_9BURK|nr:glycosyltransferase family A protein [Caballeronia glebae]SAK77613.1 glycosyl transferase family 2 [Caballeronia glebae]